ncbi:MAG: exo-alpha-sialidase [Planctomycetota bacterium]|nr:MAG: exo-alpha-sialidase [Planctomycetota bacterium]
MSVLLLLPLLLPQAPRPAQELGPAAPSGTGPAVAAVGDRSAVLFLDAAGRVQVRVSDGHGLTWTPSVRLDADPTGAARIVPPRAVAIDGDTIACLWLDARLSTAATPQFDAWLSVSTDGGATWSAEQVLEKGHPHGPAYSVLDAAVAVSGPRIHVAQLVAGAAGGEPWLVSSGDAGATWTAPLAAASVPADAEELALAAAPGAVHLAWSDDRNAAGLDDLWFRTSLDGGLGWTGAESRLDASGPGNGDLTAPGLVLVPAGAKLCLAWLENRLPTSPLDDELHFRASTDGGLSWGPEQVVASGADADDPSLSFCGCNASLAWVDDRTGQDEVYTAVSVDLGATWRRHRLSSGGGLRPVARGRADLLGVAFLTPGPPAAARIAVTRDEGLNWLPELDLDDAPIGAGAGLRLAFDEKYKNFIAAWVDAGTAGNRIRVGGMRTPTLLPTGNFTPGGAVSFAVAAFPIDEAGLPFAVPIAGGPGHYTPPFPGAYDLGLADDPWLRASLNLIPGPLSGLLAADGTGATPLLVLPSAIPPGSLLHAAAVSFAVPGPTLKTITDVVVTPVQ